jgi:hypothetical protein
MIGASQWRALADQETGEYSPVFPFFIQIPLRVGKAHPRHYALPAVLLQGQGGRMCAREYFFCPEPTRLSRQRETLLFWRGDVPPFYVGDFCAFLASFFRSRFCEKSPHYPLWRA